MRCRWSRCGNCGGELDYRLAEAPGEPPLTEAERADQELQRRLFEAGLLSGVGKEVGSHFQGSEAVFQGRLRGRRVDSRPKLWTIRWHHSSLP